MEKVQEEEDKFIALFGQTGGRINSEEKKGEKGDFIEVKVLNEQAKLAGIVWYFGSKRAYIEDIRSMVKRKETQKIDMVLVAGEGTTSAGKKELKEVKIKLLKDLETVKIKTTKKKKKTAVKVKQEEITIDDDVAITDAPDSSLIRLAQVMIQTGEPDIIKIEEVKGSDVLTYELIGYASNKDVLAVYWAIDEASIGVKLIRRFQSSLTNIKDNIPRAIIGPDKFTPSAQKEANELNINLISEREENETKGSEEQQLLNQRLIEGARDIIEQRNFKIVQKKSSKFMKLIAGSESLGTYLVAENEGDETLLILLPSEEVVRVATVREFKKQMDALKITEGMLIPLKRFTYTAEREAKEFKITALKKNHPVFNIFNHELVPEHQKMTQLEIDDMLIKYNAKINELPKIYEDDPGVVAVNGAVGDVIRVVRGHDSENFRLIIPRADGGVTESTAILSLLERRAKRKKRLAAEAAKKKGKKTTKKSTKKSKKIEEDEDEDYDDDDDDFDDDSFDEDED